MVTLAMTSMASARAKSNALVMSHKYAVISKETLSTQLVVQESMEITATKTAKIRTVTAVMLRPANVS